MEKENTGIAEAPHTITQIIKGTTAEFSHYREGALHYTVDVEGYRYEFPIHTVEKTIIPVVFDETETIEVESIKLSDDIGLASFERTYKAITLMRYIRKAIADGSIRWDKIV